MSGLQKLNHRDPRELNERCADCTIRHRAVCTYCSPQELALLDAIKFYKTFEPGQEIVAAGEETDFLGSRLSMAWWRCRKPWSMAGAKPSG
jgi:hypothetical protein